MAIAQETPAPQPRLRLTPPPVVIPNDAPDRRVVIVDGPYTLLHEDEAMVMYLANGAFRPHRNNDDIIWVTAIWSYKDVEDGLSHMAVRSQINCADGTTLTTTIVAFGPDGSFLGRYEPGDEWRTIYPDSPSAEAQAIGCGGASPHGRALPGTPVDIAKSFRR